jgi:hypothetical protein
MDTKNPVLYLEFPTGRLKLFGTLAFPHNKYMVLRLGGGGAVLCEDVFETLVRKAQSHGFGGLGQCSDATGMPRSPAHILSQRATIQCCLVCE